MGAANHADFVGTGSCLCAAVRYGLRAEPLFTHACHCRNCQKRTGSAFAMTTFVLRNDLSITHGEPKGVKNDPTSTIYSCSDCETIIYASTTRFREALILRPGTLDDPAIAAPQAHIWVKRKQSWLDLSWDVPEFDEHYDLESTWPIESLERLSR